jgi:hypothetical protein
MNKIIPTLLLFISLQDRKKICGLFSFVQQRPCLSDAQYPGSGIFTGFSLSK